MGNNNSSTSNQSSDLQFLPGDEVKISEQSSEYNNSATSALHHKLLISDVVRDDSQKDEHGNPKRAIVVVNENEESKVIGIFKPEQLILLNNEQYKRRRIEFSLLNKYVTVCKQRNAQPNETILHLYKDQIKKGEAVVKLDLKNSELSFHDVVPLCELLKRKSGVKKLDLSGNKMDETGAAHIANVLRKYQSLRELNLSNNPLGFKGAEYLAKGIEGNCSLQYLNVANCKLTADGCDVIVSALRRNTETRMVKLDLRKNEAGDKQVDNLYRLSQELKTLCFVDVYPPNDHVSLSLEDPSNSQQRQSAIAWLSYEGWIAYGNLRSTLMENANFVKTNPKAIEPTESAATASSNALGIASSDDAIDYLKYNLTLVKQGFIDNIIHEIAPAKAAGRRRSSGGKKSFNEWKREQQIKGEWKQLAPEHQRLLEMEQRLQKEQGTTSSPLDISAVLSSNLLTDVQGNPIQESSAVHVPKKKQSVARQDEDWVVLDDEFADFSELPKTPSSSSPSSSSPNQQLSINTNQKSKAKRMTSAINFDVINNSHESTKVLCNICLDDKYTSDIYIMDDCYHKFCLECIQNYVAIKINNFETDTIGCPECHKKLSPNEVKLIIKLRKKGDNDNLLNKFEDFTLKKALSTMKNLCWCPNPKCRNAMIIDTSRNSQRHSKPLVSLPAVTTTTSSSTFSSSSSAAASAASDQHFFFASSSSSLPASASTPSSTATPPLISKCVCRECATEICTACKDYYHGEINCEEYKKQKLTEEEKKNTELYNNWVKSHRVKQCPGCGATVEKRNKSCNEMNCQHCSTKWCFSCGKAFTDLKEHYYQGGSCPKWNLLDAFGIIGDE